MSPGFRTIAAGLLLSCGPSPNPGATLAADPDAGEAIELVPVRLEHESALHAENVLHLYLRPHGVIDILRGQSPNVQTIHVTALPSLLRHEVGQNAALKVGLRVDPDAIYGDLTTVLIMLRDSPVTRAVLNAPRQGEWTHWGGPAHRMSIVVEY